MENNWKFKSLETLEKKVWPALNSDEDSHLITTCYELRKKIVGDFSIEDLRIMIGQNIGLKYLIPLAIEELEKNVLAEGHYYEGDLLNAVLTSDPEFWKLEKTYHKNMTELIHKNKSLFEGWEMKKQWSEVIDDLKKSIRTSANPSIHVKHDQ